MNELDALIESYIDLLAQEIVADEEAGVAGIDPLDPAWLQAKLAALRSIAHAAEDLDLDGLQDEVDRTMLIDTMRYDMHLIRSELKPTTPEAMMEGRLAALTAEPTGVRGTLRILELRRAGVERSLHASAVLLGMDDPLATVRAIREETLEASGAVVDGWEEEWRRSGAILTALGLPVVPGDPPPFPHGEGDEWSYPALAVRGHAVRMLDASRASQTRPARRELVAPGLLAGWGRTVCALLRESVLFDLPERRLMMSWRALVEALAAEVDLKLMAGLATEEEVTLWAVDRLGGDPESATRLVSGVLHSPGSALAAALAHEAWQAWYAEDGRTPAEVPAFLRDAMAGGGLAVRLTRWAASESAQESR